MENISTESLAIHLHMLATLHISSVFVTEFKDSGKVKVEVVKGKIPMPTSQATFTSASQQQLHVHPSTSRTRTTAVTQTGRHTHLHDVPKPPAAEPLQLLELRLQPGAQPQALGLGRGAHDGVRALELYRAVPGQQGEDWKRSGGRRGEEDRRGLEEGRRGGRE